MVGHYKTHLPMRENARLGFAGGSRSVEVPKWIVIADHGFGRLLAQIACDQIFVAVFGWSCGANGNHVLKCGRRCQCGINVLRKHTFANDHIGMARLRQIGHLGWRQSKIGGHPNTAELERHPTALKHLDIVA